MSEPSPRWIGKDALAGWFGVLRQEGHRVFAPVLRDGALHFAEVSDVDEIARGLRDVQAPGRYRVEEGDPARLFDLVNGPGGLKPLVFVPREPLLQIEGEGPGRPFEARATLPAPEKVAVFGVRACDLAALRIQDRIFLHDRYPDPHYASRRAGLLLVAVSCTRAVETCFCASLDTGPAPREGYDLALTELDEGFLVRAGSPAGEALLAAGASREPPSGALEEEERALSDCARSQPRSLPQQGLPELLYSRLEHPRWDDVGERCLACGSCTLVCPTCFCHDEWDEPDAAGTSTLRVREWDSCFDPDHARIHGLDVRPRIRDRYRQWLVHKLGSWIDQFGTSGCVGCGRCITWCPVGIDLCEELAALREGPA